MAEHIKRQNESMREFRHRVLAWNDGEPVPPEAPIVVSDGENPHQYYREGLYCKAPGCYATKRDKKVLKTCPQECGTILKWKLFGFIRQTPWIDR
jgi:hypothetical protein